MAQKTSKKGRKPATSRRIRQAEALLEERAALAKPFSELDVRLDALGRPEIDPTNLVGTTTPNDNLDDNLDGVPWDEESVDASRLPPSAFSGKGTAVLPTPGEVMDALKSGAGHRVTVIKDHLIEYPELYLEVWITGPMNDQAGFAEMFVRARCTRAKSLAESDLCVFTGGSDVDPGLYGEVPHSSTKFSQERDTDDINTYLYCLENGVPMLGICRGAQFLHVMQGGKLFQDVDNHYGDHSIFDLKEKRTIEKVSSTHHQMVAPEGKGFIVLATANKSRTRHRNPDDSSIGPYPDIEAFFYRDVCAIGIQGHPEYRGYNFFSVWALKKIEEFVVNNPDTDWINGCRRLKPDILAMRTKPELVAPRNSEVN